MGQTLLQSIAQRRNGLLLFESFESANFATDQGWTVLNGTPALSNSVAKDSLYSLAMDTTCALIQFAAPSYFTCSAVWFYDDASKTTQNAKPFVVWKDSNGTAVFGLGVNNTVSTTFYSALTAAGTWQATNIPRVTGWHRFSFSADSTPLPHLYIDNLDCGVVLTAAAIANTIQVGCQSNTGDGFGWFDWVQVCADQFVTFYNLDVGQGLVLVCSGSVPEGLAVNGTAQVDLAFVDSPVDAYAAVVALEQQAGMVLIGPPTYQSDVDSFSAGDIYFLNKFRFGRRPSSVAPIATSSRNDTLSVDGVKQSVFFYDSDRVSLTFDGITDDQRNELSSWWSMAKRGQTFSVTLDEDDSFLDFTRQAVTGFPTGQLVLAQPPPGAGKNLVVQSADGTIKETLVLAGQSTFDPATGLWTANLTRPQAEAVAAGLQVRSLNYWPFCTVEGTAFQISLRAVQVKRWNFTLNFQEVVQKKPFAAFYVGLNR